MFRKHWREPAFWRWWWGNRAPAGAKASLLSLAALAVIAAGFFAAVSFSSADARAPSSLTFETTVERLVTVREHGRVVVRRAPVVRRVVYRPQTAFRTLVDTRVITTRGKVRYVPVTRKRVVTVDGRTRTITETRLLRTTSTQTETQTQTRTRTRTQTQTQVETQTNVVTQQQTVVRTETQPVTVERTVVRTETLPPATVTQTVPAVTVTVTVPTVTVP